MDYRDYMGWRTRRPSELQEWERLRDFAKAIIAWGRELEWRHAQRAGLDMHLALRDAMQAMGAGAANELNPRGMKRLNGMLLRHLRQHGVWPDDGWWHEMKRRHGGG